MLEYNRTPNSIETNTAQNPTEEQALRMLLGKAVDENERLKLQVRDLEDEIERLKEMVKIASTTKVFIPDGSLNLACLPWGW